MRKTVFAPNEYYHVLNRGNNKQTIFFNDADRIRFLLSILLFQSPLVIKNMDRVAKEFVQNPILHSNKEIDDEMIGDIISNRFVELICFTLMPNHFHLLIREIKKGGVAKYMQKIQISYTKYFNIKNDKVGHHFQGGYKAVHITKNNQLLYLSTYIHRNSREINLWKGRENLYPWSSLQDYTSINRWGDILKRNIILGQFENPKKYKEFVKNSSAKTLRRLDRDYLLLLD
ncbi:MAG: transposase [Minisyncoccia bacterium]